MRFNFITSFLIISCLVLSSSINKSILTCAVDPKKHVTKEYLSNICSKSSNPYLCLHVLKDLIGHPLAKTTFSTLAIRPISMAEPHARETRKMIETMYHGLIDPNREVRDRYRSCIVRYDDVIKYMVEAKRYLKSGDYKKVKSYASGALNRVNSCDKNFAKPPPEPLNLRNANKKFKDLCSIIVTI
ncbi:hypothetical protein DH2020_036733 [Rehmannia glutinosa]|uniref:Pectinesterase inhibitor domain-containing protein n=1 Tax=Rehmannia glutinosa TaxID=99300 RepID=A0ABR0V392_REHGL